MKRLLLPFLLLAPFLGFSQQEARYAQFHANKLAFNPAYAGSRDAVSGTLLFRQQWAGLDQAPRTLTAALHAPLRNRRIGLGVQLVHDRLGEQTSNGIYTTYAYRLPVGKGFLATGVQAGLVQMQFALEETNPLDAGDPLLNSPWNHWLPNAGAGVYWNDEHSYAGISVPQLLRVRLSPSGEARTQRHVYATAGRAVRLGPLAQLRTQVLLQFVNGAPWQGQVDANVLLADRFWTGAGYRTVDHALLVHAGVQLPGEWRLGYSYDYTFGSFGPFANDSHELTLAFDLPLSAPRFASPRSMSPRLF